MAYNLEDSLVLLVLDGSPASKRLLSVPVRPNAQHARCIEGTSQVVVVRVSALSMR
jgi:hypothetical protein